MERALKTFYMNEGGITLEMYRPHIYMGSRKTEGMSKHDTLKVVDFFRKHGIDPLFVYAKNDYDS